jgi:response regulator RpfG family c-di-GMP phosphodiesterase
MSTLTERETDVLPLIHKHSVLCVDDEPSILAALRRTLCKEPYDLLMTESPWHALQYVETRPISLVLSDQRMPDMSGLELLEAIHQYSPATIGVILTGFPESFSQHRGIEESVRCVLVKPWDNQALTRTVRQLLREMELSRIHPSIEEDRESEDLGGEA